MTVEKRITEALAAYHAEGVEAMLPYVHPEFSMTTTSEVASEPDTYQGHDGLRRYFASFLEVMDEVRIEPVEVEERGDRALVTFNLARASARAAFEAA